MGICRLYNNSLGIFRSLRGILYDGVKLNSYGTVEATSVVLLNLSLLFSSDNFFKTE